MKKFLLMSFLTSSLIYGDNISGAVLAGKGKFVFGQLSEYGSSKYMLNTETGELWNIQRDDANTSILARVYFDCYNLKLGKDAHCSLPVDLIEDEVKIKFGKK